MHNFWENDFLHDMARGMALVEEVDEQRDEQELGGVLLVLGPDDALEPPVLVDGEGVALVFCDGKPELELGDIPEQGDDMAWVLDGVQGKLPLDEEVHDGVHG